MTDAGDNVSLATLTKRVEYADRIAALPKGPLAEAEFGPFLMDNSHPPIEIYYAPFDWLNLDAKVVIVGITPGRNSMRVALETARDAIHAGLPLEEAAKRAKETGSFLNMRKNLSTRLDALGVHDALGITSCLELFSTRSDLLHTTSAVRYPVFKSGKNYGGYSPSLTGHELLKRYLHDYLAPEISLFPKAMFVQNGRAVAEALLAAGLEERRCLIGFPHASNGPGAKDRARSFESEKEQMRSKVAAWGPRLT